MIQWRLVAFTDIVLRIYNSDLSIYSFSGVVAAVDLVGVIIEDRDKHECRTEE